MSSNFLDSDSDSHHGRYSDSSDDDLPTYDICSSARPAELCESPTITTTDPTSSPRISPPATQLEVRRRSPQFHLASSCAVSSSPPLPSTSSPSKRQCLANSSGGMDSDSFSAILSSPDSALSILSINTTPGCLGSSPSAAPSPQGMSSVTCTLSSPGDMVSRLSVISNPSGGGSRLSDSPSASPLKLMERYEKTLHQHDKLTRTVENLTANIKTRMEKKHKLEKYRSRGGICGISIILDKKDTHSFSSEGEDEFKPLEALSVSATFRQQQQQQQREADKFPLPLHPPGLPVLLHTPSLLLDLHPPTTCSEKEDDELHANNHNQQKSELLSQLICDCWFSLQYSSKPCPMNLWEWLFQTACLSCDQHLGQAALSNLTSLLEYARGAGRNMWPVFVPTPSHVLQVLIAMGADQNMLSEKVEQTSSQALENAKDVIHTPCSPSVIANLAHLHTYLPLAVQARPNLLSTQDIHSLIIMVATLSLDSSLLQQDTLQILHIMSHAISVLLEAIPESSWHNSISFLTATLRALSLHHHDHLHICKLLIPSSSRTQELQKLTCRYYLWMLLFPDNAIGVPSSLQDWELAWRVVKHFHDQPSSAFHYYSMYSVMCTLSLLVSSSEMNWPSPAKEEEFRDMLANLALVRIKDHPDKTERVPVKDLLIFFKLEMDSTKSKQTHQMDLFSMLKA